MYTPIFVLDAHVQAVNTNRLRQARRAELIRLAQHGRQAPINRIIANLRQSTGSTLVSIGQWLQRTPVDRVVQELEAMSVTETRTSSSYR